MNIAQLRESAQENYGVKKMNCAEAVLKAMCDYWGIQDQCVPAVATAFGGGVCSRQGICGAVSGGLMAIGCKMNRDGGTDAKQKCMETAKRYIDWVEKGKGTSLCRELTGVDFSDASQQEKRAKARVQVCMPLVADCCQWIAENL